MIKISFVDLIFAVVDEYEQENDGISSNVCPVDATGKHMAERLEYAEAHEVLQHRVLTHVVLRLQIT